jgi:hypothetical protein
MITYSDAIPVSGHIEKHFLPECNRIAKSLSKDIFIK